jgi:benzylsuccinate CoA-transferase BbsE subunit
MPAEKAHTGALSGIRVLELATNSAAYAGRLLADLGADVICIEPPANSPTRSLPPLQRLESGETFSFAHAFLCAGKRSVTLDLDRPNDRELFCQLATGADVVLETPDPVGLAEKDLGYNTLRGLNPRLIVVSISPYGQGGPRSADKASDLTLLAAGGLLSFGGYGDTEPLGVHGDQAYLGSGIFGAIATLAALIERGESGPGQWIDVSGQECVAFALEDAVPEWYLHQQVRRRSGDRAREAGTGVYPCQDGYVSMVAGRLGTAKAFATLTGWVAETGTRGGEQLLEPQWQDFKHRQSPEGVSRFAEVFGEFCRTRTKEELYREGQRRQIAIAPVNSVGDLTRDAQLSANSYFQPQFDERLGKELIYPGSPYRHSRTPASLQSRAPGLGEHNAEILHGELGAPNAPSVTRVGAGASAM